MEAALSVLVFSVVALEVNARAVGAASLRRLLATPKVVKNADAEPDWQAITVTAANNNAARKVWNEEKGTAMVAPIRRLWGGVLMRNSEGGEEGKGAGRVEVNMFYAMVK